MPSNVPQGRPPLPNRGVGGAAPPPPPQWGNRPGDSWDGATQGSARPAGFWIRVVATIVDSVILMVPMLILWTILLSPFMEEIGDGRQMPEDMVGPFIGAIFMVVIAMIIVSWLYEALMTASSSGATLGKMLMGVKVVRGDYTQLSFGRATGRYFAKSVITNMVPFAIGYMMAGFTNRKRALHDMVADTVVIRSR